MEKTLNIVHLHVIYHRYFTGVDRYLEMYRRGMRSQSECDNVKIHTVFCTDDPKAVFPRIETSADGELSAVIPLPQQQKLIFEDVFWKARYMKVIAEMLAPHLSGKANLIYQYHNLFMSDLAAELKQSFGGHIVTHLHCLPWKYNFERDTPRFNRLQDMYDKGEFAQFREEERSKVKYATADYAICLSRVAKDYLVKIHDIDPERIGIVLNGLDPRVPVPPRVEQEETEILYVGKVSRDKGVLELLKALKTVKERGCNFRLRIAGTCTGEMRSALDVEYKDLNIDYMGQVPFEKLAELYSSCSFGVIPSLHEQCSYVALEMAMFSLPVIVSEVDALAEMFTHEETALLTPLVFDADFGLTADTAAFADNIIRLIEDRELREKLSRGIGRQYEESFTLGKMVEETMKVYNRLV